MNNFEKQLTDIKPEYSFDVTLKDFEQIIINGFIQLEAF